MKILSQGFQKLQSANRTDRQDWM